MTLEELHALNDHDLLLRIATKVEALVGNGQPGRCAQHAARIARLERLVWMAVGAWTLLLALLSVYVALIKAK